MIGHVTVNCARKGCFAIITMHPDDEKRLRSTHETFYCPVGHGNLYTGKTDEEKRIAQLERNVGQLERSAQTDYEIRERLVDALKTCPLGCGWRARRHVIDRTVWVWGYGQLAERIRGDLEAHLYAEHNAMSLVPVGAEEAES
jgi:hypothetical protein